MWRIFDLIPRDGKLTFCLECFYEHSAFINLINLQIGEVE